MEKRYDKALKLGLCNWHPAPGNSQAQVERDLGIGRDHQLVETTTKSDGEYVFHRKERLKPKDQENRDLKYAVQPLRRMCNILRKAVAIFSEDPHHVITPVHFSPSKLSGLLKN
jgi:hypothetical protein